MHDLGRMSEAETYYRGARADFERSPGADTFSLPNLLDQLAKLYHSQNCDSEAEQLFLCALQLREKSAIEADRNERRSLRWSAPRSRIGLLGQAIWRHLFSFDLMMWFLFGESPCLLSGLPLYFSC